MVIDLSNSTEPVYFRCKTHSTLVFSWNIVRWQGNFWRPDKNPKITSKTAQCETFLRVFSSRIKQKCHIILTLELESKGALNWIICDKILSKPNLDFIITLVVFWLIKIILTKGSMKYLYLWSTSLSLKQVHGYSVP